MATPRTLHDTLVSEVAKLPLELLVTPAAEQKDDEQKVCFVKGVAKPVIIYERESGGLYEEPVRKWLNTDTGHTGFGCVELFADLKRTTMEGDNLRQICKAICDLGKMENEFLGKFDYREQVAVQDVLTFELRADFTFEHLWALGCKTWLNKDGILRYSFDSTIVDNSYFSPMSLHKDMNVWALASVTLPKRKINGEWVSEKVYSTPFNPLFAAFANDEKKCGCVFRPAMPSSNPIVFSNDDKITVSRLSRWVGGDRIFMFAQVLQGEHTSNTKYTGVLDAIENLNEERKKKADQRGTEYVPYTEHFQTTENRWIEQENGKMDEQEVRIEKIECKADNIIFCSNIADAVAAYYHLNALRHSYPLSDNLKDRAYHVAFTYDQNVDFTKRQYYKLSKFAHRVYTLFPSDTQHTRKARAIGRRFPNIYRASLPSTFGNPAYSMATRVYQHEPNTVRDFFLTYRMTNEQAITYDYDINKLMRRCFGSAINTMPFVRRVKRNRDGSVKEEFFSIDIACVWEFVAACGYVRDVDPDSTNKIGRFVKLDGPFADELDAPSMLAAVKGCLTEYAKEIARPNSDDFKNMTDAIANNSKGIKLEALSSLPSMAIDYTQSYGRNLDYLFFQNGAIRITPSDITFVPYSRINFFIDRGNVMKGNFTMPFRGDNDPFDILQSQEYEHRKSTLESHIKEKDEHGNPAYSSKQISEEREKLMEWGKLHRWKVDFHGRKVIDLWPTLQVIRGFANERWDEEEELIADGEQFSEEQQAELDGHLANLLFAFGRMCFRWREGSKSNCIPYLTENGLQPGQKAQGGSGKSAFINTFLGCCRPVLKVDAKLILAGKDFTMYLQQFQPRKHAILHFEDWKENVAIDPLYNFTTSGVTFQRKYENMVSVPLNRAPGIIVSSNFALKSNDDSTIGRLCFVGFSHRFCRENPFREQAARMPSDIMPDFSASSPDTLSVSSRNQIAWIGAKCIQFVMRYDTKVNCPDTDIKKRNMVQAVGETFYAWYQDFLQQMDDFNLWGTPIDLASCFDEYKRYYAESSEKRVGDYKLFNFRRNLTAINETSGVICNPDQIFKEGNRKVGKRGAYAVLSTWVTKTYFDGKEWENDDTVHIKQIRVFEQSKNVVLLYRKNVTPMPANHKELMAAYERFKASGKDPCPKLDDEGKPVELTEDERKRWTDFLHRRQGQSASYGGVIPVGGHAFNEKPLTREEEQKLKADLPF